MATQPTSPTPPPDPGATPEGQGLKKYIRTFAGDMEMLKKGGLPDLKPFNKPPAPAPVPSPAPAPVPAPVPTPPPVPTTPLPAPVSPGPLSESMQQSVPASPPPVPTGPSPIETYAYDFQNRVQSTRASTATILAAEQDVGRVTPVPTRSRGGIVSVIAGVILLLLGAGGAYVAYLRYTATTAPVPLLAPPPVSPIFVDEQEKISATTGAQVLQGVEQSLTRPLTNGGVRLLIPDFASTTRANIFVVLEPSAPGALLRNITDSGSIAGIVSVNGVESPFFILSVSSYSDTFAAMLSWEPVLPGTMSALYPPYPPAVTPTSTTTEVSTATTKKTKSTSTAKATTTPAVTPIFSVFFHDEVVASHDVRIYRDGAGRSIVIYGYFDQKTLVIARDPSAFMELVTRLTTSRNH